MWFILPKLPLNKKKKLLHDSRIYIWDEPYLFNQGPDGIIHRCVAEVEFTQVLQNCHSSPYSGHYGGERTTKKVLQSDFFWPTLFRNAVDFVKSCDQCQRLGAISRRHEMPLNNSLEVEVFNVWEIDFMGLFPPFNGNLYILVAVDTYLSGWKLQLSPIMMPEWY